MKSSVSYRIVYKSVGQYVISLKLDDECKTNENRKYIFDPMYAKNRCDRAYVVDILNKFTKESIDSIESDFDETFVYVRNKYITVDDYDASNEICSRGIHYYMSYEAAYFHGLDKVENGEYLQFYDDGELFEKCNYVNGLIHGLYESWYRNGQLYKRCNYVNGVIHGLCELWYENGQLEKKYKYINGSVNGIYESWYRSGHLFGKCYFVNGKITDTMH